MIEVIHEEVTYIKIRKIKVKLNILSTWHLAPEASNLFSWFNNQIRVTLRTSYLGNVLIKRIIEIWTVDVCELEVSDHFSTIFISQITCNIIPNWWNRKPINGAVTFGVIVNPSNFLSSLNIFHDNFCRVIAIPVFAMN